MDINQAPGPAGIKRATRNIRGRMSMAWSRVHGPDCISMAKKSMKEILIKGFRLGNGPIIMTRIKKPWRKSILSVMKNVKKNILQENAIEKGK